MAIRDFVIIEDNVQIGENLDTGSFIVIRNDVSIGDNVSIWSHCTIDPGVKIGDNVKIHNTNYIAQFTVIEDDVFIGPGCIFLNDKYPPRYDKEVWEPPIIKKGTSIGGGSIIGPGVVIGENSIVGAGSIVLRDIPSGQIWFGNPAKRYR